MLAGLWMDYQKNYQIQRFYLPSFIDMWRLRIERYNVDYDEIPDLTSTGHILTTDSIFSDDWFLALKSVISARRKLEDKTQLCAQRAQILKAIDRRCDIIQSDQSKWINSALERNNKAIVIDKLIYENDDER